MMNEQEKKIVRLLLNEMAFEGAMRHFNEVLPDLSRDIFDELEAIGIPEKYDGQMESYRYKEIAFDLNKSAFENCYLHLRTIRNNIIHANKAYLPDPPERLSDLLNWSDRFIERVYDADCNFSRRALEIKTVLKIESF